ncbi:similar to Saccharomyces cerevisiae YPR168W NUT2 Subunit of the RNA polymerase II mediator complex [Geotrichum candidum]|uniref:Mediator of RNA polymerase II transcription subunit 10 n=1 Tax=Geotrichum candidum TaxID=1173061 RepID=A0A0J9XGR2_GEOCN|nr:similar to Saccharomyces cerevisiae YPR168W NUT2 Subunit of the RNA polymerase II mediator complex [Geotrichum candidum]
MSEPTSTAAATVSDFNQEAASLQETEAQLRQVIETFIELGIIVHDFQGTVEAKEGLVERVNVLMKQMDDLNFMGYKLDHRLPVDVVNYVEKGRNPDVYTREFVELLAKQNQYINGKMRAMKDFQDILGNTVKEAYPQLEYAIDNVKARTSGHQPPPPPAATQPAASAPGESNGSASNGSN